MNKHILKKNILLKKYNFTTNKLNFKNLNVSYHYSFIMRF